jgi:hypothetical protein
LSSRWDGGADPADFHIPQGYGDGCLILRRPNGAGEAYVGKYGLAVTRRSHALTPDQIERIMEIVREPRPALLLPVPEGAGLGPPPSPDEIHTRLYGSPKRRRR